MVYVSTVGVAGGLDRRDPVREDEDARSLWRERPIDSGYAVGYATSKWAGEILMRELADRFGVPAAVCRCSMIMPHRRYAGQVNAGDFLTRLLASVVQTGVAPRSFYASGGSHHFDGLPVDVVAGSIAAIAADPRGGLATYHVTNPHWDDGVSLDTMVDWIRSAGYAVTRIDDHARWFEAFTARLEALPAALKPRSALPIVHQWAQPVSGDMRFDSTRLRQRLHAELPHLTEPYVHTYLRDMVAVRLIGPPGSKLESAA
jgi:fatty acid CoA ligase FadD9